MPECLILTSSNIWNVDKICHRIVIYLPHQISQLKYRHQNLVHLYFPSFEKKNSNFNSYNNLCAYFSPSEIFLLWILQDHLFIDILTNRTCHMVSMNCDPWPTLFMVISMRKYYSKYNQNEQIKCDKTDVR